MDPTVLRKNGTNGMHITIMDPTVLRKNGTNGMHITINGSHCAKNYIYPACMKEEYRHHKHEEHSTKYFLFKMKKKIRIEDLNDSKVL